MTKTPAAAKAPNNCACSEFEIGIGITAEEDGQPDFDGTATGCTKTTRRTFSPGCDAKLKSLLIRAGVEGLEVRHNSGITYGDPASAARQFGFADMVAAGIQRGIAKAAAKAAKAAAPKAPRKAAKKDKTSADKTSADERAAKLTAKMAEVAGKVTVSAPPAPVAEPIVEAAPEATEAPAGTIRIRLGRWEYTATVVDGDAHYTDAKGVARVALEGNYKKI
jgi:hypothetical protein